MNNLERLARNYRNRAKQLRALAETDKSPRTSGLLLEIADSYDKRAATADAIERTYGELRKGEPEKVSGAGNQPLWYANSSLLAPRHVGAFFHSAEEEHEALLPFIKDGFEQGHKVLHVIDPNRRDDYRTRLMQAGIDLAGAERSGQFELLSWTESYLRDGRFDKDRMLALVANTLKDSKEQGYESTQMVGHMEWALGERPGVEDLLEYEARVNDISDKHADGFCCCVYDLAKFDGATVVNIIRTHPVLMIGGILQENPYYVPPDTFLREWHGSRQ